MLADNFYLSKDELLHDSPSRRAGVAAATETSLRIFGCERVQLGVLYLRLPQVRFLASAAQKFYLMPTTEHQVWPLPFHCGGIEARNRC